MITTQIVRGRPHGIHIPGKPGQMSKGPPFHFSDTNPVSPSLASAPAPKLTYNFRMSIDVNLQLGIRIMRLGDARNWFLLMAVLRAASGSAAVTTDLGF